MSRALPTERQLTDLLEGLLALRVKVGPKKEEKRYKVEVLVERVRRAYERDRTGTSIPDGYPRGSGFDSAGGGTRFKVDSDPDAAVRKLAEDGYVMEPDGESSIELTSVELAIEHRVFATKTVKDHHHDYTVAAVAELRTVVDALDRLRANLELIDNLTDTNPDASTAVKGCRSHARIKDGLGRSYFEPIDRDSGGRDGLCRWCFGWQKDTERNPDGALPPVGLLERLVLHGKVTSRDIAEVAAAERRAS